MHGGDDDHPVTAAPLTAVQGEVREPGWYVAAASFAAGLVALWAVCVRMLATT